MGCKSVRMIQISQGSLEKASSKRRERKKKRVKRESGKKRGNKICRIISD